MDITTLDGDGVVGSRTQTFATNIRPTITVDTECRHILTAQLKSNPQAQFIPRDDPTLSNSPLPQMLKT